jgi:hypothetical protein
LTERPAPEDAAPEGPAPEAPEGPAPGLAATDGPGAGEVLPEDRAVRVGSMLFTMVDPDRGHEVAYNRWYERDHFYGGCLVGPWLFAGRRFVATRALKDLRFPAGSPFASPLDAGSYLAIYWIHAGHVGEHLKWAGQQVRWLYGAGRGFEARTHAHTGLYDLVSVAYRDADPVPLELSLDHSFAGLAVLVLEPAGGGAVEALEEARRAVLLAPGSPAASCSSFAVRRSARAREAEVPMALGSEGGSDDRIVQLVFLEAEPAGAFEVCRDYAAAVDAGGAASVSFAAPFLPTDVGTDRYTDQLW